MNRIGQQVSSICLIMLRAPPFLCPSYAIFYLPNAIPYLFLLQHGSSHRRFLVFHCDCYKMSTLLELRACLSKNLAWASPEVKRGSLREPAAIASTSGLSISNNNDAEDVRIKLPATSSQNEEVFVPMTLAKQKILEVPPPSLSFLSGPIRRKSFCSDLPPSGC